MKMHPLKMVVGMLIVCGVSTGAQADEKALQAALNKSQMMLRQAAADKVSADKQVAELKAELQKSKDEFDRYKRNSENQAQASEQNSARMATTVDSIKDRYSDLAAKFQQLQQEYRQSIAARQQAEAGLRQVNDNFQLCLGNNHKLYDINQEILGNYEEKGFWEVIRGSEPFTGFHNVKIENLIQDYQYQNADLKIDEALLGSSNIEN